MSIKKGNLTFEDLAVHYDKYHNGRKARTLPLETVYEWATSRPDLFVMNEDTTISYNREQL
ncbi:MAG: hypothetical protein DRR42_26090 [Gammaproteobacteria bacterium]|nr:MAG: hypothetical protein DRR42_26090 [Gammaproteobacteria bacterium]